MQKERRSIYAMNTIGAMISADAGRAENWRKKIPNQRTGFEWRPYFSQAQIHSTAVMNTRSRSKQQSNPRVRRATRCFVGCMALWYALVATWVFPGALNGVAAAARMATASAEFPCANHGCGCDPAADARGDCCCSRRDAASAVPRTHAGGETPAVNLLAAAKCKGGAPIPGAAAFVCIEIHTLPTVAIFVKFAEKREYPAPASEGPRDAERLRLEKVPLPTA